MNRQLLIFLHVAIWAFMFLSPLTFMRGNGLHILQYLMNCMTPLLMMVVFYVNYLWLTPRHFVIGKRRYYLLFNVVMVVVLGIFLHVWVVNTQMHFQTDGPPRYESSIDMVLLTVRDILSLAMSAAVATAIVLAMRFQHNEDARLAAEAARADAELKNLRSQINPHFLLNTLNNIYALTAFNQSAAQDAIQQLSKMLRHLLYDNQQDFVALKDEIQFLDNYVSLMKIRLPQQVDVRFDHRVSNPELQVAPLIYISLVENAFKHGISPTEPSFVHISLTTAVEQFGDNPAADVLTLSISNSYHPKTHQDHSGHGIGLSQVRRRLELTYPKRYEWQRGVTGDGTVYTSTIKIKL